MVSEIGQPDRVRHHAEYVERYFGGTCYLIGSPQTLNQGCGAADKQSLRQAEFENSEKDEQKIDRHGAINAGQSNLEAGGKNCDCQITEKTQQIVAMPMAKRKYHDQYADGRSYPDKYFCFRWH